MRLLADKLGLTGWLSAAMAQPGFMPVYDRGGVIRDVAVMIADGGEAISDISTLRDQDELFGPVPSYPTVWRTLVEMNRMRRRRIARARARCRAEVWQRLANTCGIPASKVADRDLGATVVLDVDATIVVCHSEKEEAAGTFKRTFGYHPLGVWCDNTQEWLACQLRPGNAGSNTAADHIAVLTEAFAQVPLKHRRKLLVRVDGAGASHGLISWLTTQDSKRGFRVEYSVGFAIGARVQEAIAMLPEEAWDLALDADGGVREGGEVAEVTGLLDLAEAGWPEQMRVIVRRERPHPGAQLTLFEAHDGWRYTAFATNTQIGQLQFLEVRHRAHARVEDRIRHAKATGIGRFPSREFDINQSWLVNCQIAADLLAWLRLFALTDDLAKAEPKKLRYRLLHTAARITRGARRRRLRLPRTWPWTSDLVACFARIAAIPKVA